MKYGYSVTRFVVTGMLLVGVGCASETSGPAQSMKHESGMKATEPSLYERLGKKEAITAVVDDFVGRVANDSRINGKFATADIPRLKRLLVEQICAASGGPARTQAAT